MKQYELLKDCFDDDLLNVEKAGNIFVDWNFELDKQMAGQAIYIYALKDLLKIEKILGKETVKIEEEISRKTEAAMKLYDEKQGLFLSGKDRQISYASQVWAIMAGIADAKKGQKILKNLKAYPEAIPLNSPYGYHHYIQALIDVGLKDEAYRAMHEYWDGMIRQGSDTFWEIYNPEDPDMSPYGGLVVHSFCHAWSCTPSYFLRKYFYK